MTDIVERLMRSYPTPLEEEAAREITRLRALNKETQASLREMIDCYGSDDGGGPIPIIERARAALEQKP